MPRMPFLLCLLLVMGCDSTLLGGDDDGNGDGGTLPTGDAGPGGAHDTLETGSGCAGVFNPDQVLDYELTLASGDWSTVQNDMTNSVYVPAQLSCGGGASLQVAIRRKRSGGAPKVGLKVDINYYVDGQSFSGLKKLSLENGISEGSTTGSTHELVAEYLGWRLMSRSGAMTGRAAFARVSVNGQLLGVYVNVEELDKRFLRDRLGDDSGWLYKKSGSANDGYHTNETLANPYAGYFCFWEQNGCVMPESADLAGSLPEHLAVEQMLRVGAVNALIANTDAPLLKDNNYAFYDWAGGPRQYFPWDLDTTMRDDYDVFTGTVSGGTDKYTQALFSNWAADYDAILTELLAGSLSLAAIHSELDRVVSVAGSALDADPYAGGGSGGAVSELHDWWTARHAAVKTQVEAH